MGFGSTHDSEKDMAPILSNFYQLRYCISMATKLDMRIQEYCALDVFVFTTIMNLCLDLGKKIELNIWVDPDLNVPLLIRSFPR